jgi:hypothetical protein
VQDADDVFGAAAPERHARDRTFKRRVDHLFGRVVGAYADHLRAMDHHVGNLEFPKTEDILDVFRLALLDPAVLGRLLDELLDFDIGQDFAL